MLIIDGETFNIPCEEIDINADFLDKYAERTENGDLERELIGVYFNYKLKITQTLNTAEFTRLWNKLTEPQEFHTVVVPGIDGDYMYTAYFSNVKTKMVRQYNGRNYFDGVSVNFTAKSPARR